MQFSAPMEAHMALKNTEMFYGDKMFFVDKTIETSVTH